MAYVTSLVNAEGGQWFDMQWKPAIDTPAWHKAISFYVDMLKADGPPGATSNGFNENLALFASGHCGMWIDATVAGGLLYDKKHRKSPTRSVLRDADGQLQGRADLALELESRHPATSKQGDAARTFISWATSKEYIRLVATIRRAVDAAGTRASTYAIRTTSTRRRSPPSSQGGRHRHIPHGQTVRRGAPAPSSSGSRSSRGSPPRSAGDHRRAIDGSRQRGSAATHRASATEPHDAPGGL